MIEQSQSSASANKGVLRLPISKDRLIDLTPEQENQILAEMALGKRPMKACVIYEGGDTTRYCPPR